MGMIDRFIGGDAISTIGRTATDLTDALNENATRKMELSSASHAAALTQFSSEFQMVEPRFFDRVVNGLNRLPRPALALGTLGLFAYAMAAPAAFAVRMEGLSLIPEPLWWLLGAIVSFYFGAREAHYFRVRKIAAPRGVPLETPLPVAPNRPSGGGGLPHGGLDTFVDNAALQDWASSRR